MRGRAQVRIQRAASGAVLMAFALGAGLLMGPDGAFAGGGAAADPGEPSLARRTYPATVAKRRLEAPPPPPPTPEQIEQQIQYKIAGGKTAVKGQFPWQVALVRAGHSDLFAAYYCGGTLIADRYVLTAAHCTYDENPSGGDGLPMAANAIDVLVGTHNFEGGTTHKVARIERHAFDHATYDNDVAILELDTPLPLGGDVQAIGLIEPSAEVYGVNVQGRVTGWGATVPGPIPPELRKKAVDLQFVDVTIKDLKPCNGRYVEDYRTRIFEAEIRRGRSQEEAARVRDQKVPPTSVMVTANMFCAGGSRDARQDSCSGDSGGPFLIRQINDEGAPVSVQSGIVSWGPSEGCGLIDRYGVYVRLERFRGWIDERIGR